MATRDAVSQVLRGLRSGTKIEASSLAAAPTLQGLYVLWFVGPPKACLKVGIAGLRKGTGLRGRLRFHFSSNPKNSVLARHLARDLSSRWSIGYDLTKRVQRQAFLAERCYFQARALPDISRRDLEMLEAALIQRLRPAYVGRVGTQDRKVSAPDHAERDQHPPGVRRPRQPAKAGAPVTRKVRAQPEKPEWGRLLPWVSRLRSDCPGSGNEVSDETIRGLVEDLYKARIVYSFDWPGWQPEADRLYRNDKALRAASLSDLRKLLTTHVRKDRFCEGHLKAMVTAGHVLAILEQVARRVNDPSFGGRQGAESSSRTLPSLP
jgi:hypothetical protein